MRTSIHQRGILFCLTTAFMLCVSAQAHAQDARPARAALRERLLAQQTTTTDTTPERRRAARIAPSTRGEPYMDIQFRDGRTVTVTEEQASRIRRILGDPEQFRRAKLRYKKAIIARESIRAPRELSRDRGVIRTNVLFAVLFFLVFGTSAFVFNNVVEAHGDDLNKVIRRIPGMKMFDGEGDPKRRMARVAYLFLFVLMFAIVGAHISPDFVLWKVENIGMLIVTFLAIVLGTYTKDFLRFFVARSWKCPALFKPNIMGLVFAIACVIVGRWMGVSPGYIFGIPIGLYIFSHVFEEREGVLEFLGLVWMMILAIAVWILLPLAPEYELLTDFLTLLYVILIEGVFFELLPLGYLPGSAIFKWKKWVWALFFIPVVFLLFHTAFNPSSTLNTLERASPTTKTMIIMGLYAAITMVVWGSLQLKRRLAHS